MSIQLYRTTELSGQQDWEESETVPVSKLPSIEGTEAEDCKAMPIRVTTARKKKPPKEEKNWLDKKAHDLVEKGWASTVQTIRHSGRARIQRAPRWQKLRVGWEKASYSHMYKSHSMRRSTARAFSR